MLAQKKAERERNRATYLRQQQEWRAAHPEQHAEQQRQRDPVKVRARRLAAKHVPLGPCEVCGTTEDVHRHHDDYSKPLQVRMLCRQHHAEVHVSP